MKHLDRYVIRELFVPTFTGTAIIALLFAANELIAVFQQLSVQQVPAIAIAQLVLLRVPLWLSFTFPLGIALGSALAVSRLVREGELTAIRSAGVSVRRALLGVWITATLFAVGSYLIGEYVTPQAGKKHAQLSAEAFIVSSRPTFQSNVTFRLPPYMVFIREIRRIGDDKLALNDVVLVEMSGPREVAVFRAETGNYVAGKWNFSNPKVWLWQGDNLVEIARPQEVELNQEIDIAGFFESQRPEHVTIGELKSRIVTGKKAGLNVNELEMQLQSRYALPISCVIFAMLSVVLAFRFSKASAFQGLMLSFSMALIYYNAHVVAITIFGPNRWVPAVLAPWLPVAGFAIVALIGMWRLE